MVHASFQRGKNPSHVTGFSLLGQMPFWFTRGILRNRLFAFVTVTRQDGSAECERVWQGFVEMVNQKEYSFVSRGKSHDHIQVTHVHWHSSGQLTVVSRKLHVAPSFAKSIKITLNNHFYNKNTTFPPSPWPYSYINICLPLDQYADNFPSGSCHTIK